MGHGVAQLCASSGFNVMAIEMNDNLVAGGVGAIEKSLGQIGARGVKKGTMDQAAADLMVAETLGRITGTSDIGAVAECDLVVEAIVEDMAIKVPFWENVGSLVTDKCILASNTSSYSITEMALASNRPSQMVGLHYFNPVQIMKLVEVVSTPHTDPAITAAAFDFVKATKKVPVDCKDTEGFIVNRLLVPYITEGIAMLARGDATAADIDTAMKLGAGHPMGPITLSDYVGNDINLAVMKGWRDKYPNNSSYQIDEGVALLEKMCAEGKLGRKTGQGFYKWEGNKCLGA